MNSNFAMEVLNDICLFENRSLCEWSGLYNPDHEYMHRNTAKTLLTVIPAFSAKSVVGNAISFIQKQRPLLFPLLAHSRHSKQSSFPAENRKTTEKIH